MSNQTNDPYLEVLRLRTDGMKLADACEKVGISKSKFAYLSQKSRAKAVVPSRRRPAIAIPMDVPRGTSSRISISGTPEDLAGFLVSISRRLNG